MSSPNRPTAGACWWTGCGPGPWWPYQLGRNETPWPSAAAARQNVVSWHGLKWAGTELPGIRVGSFHTAEHVTFAVCRGHKPGIVLDLADSKYDSVVLTIENPDEIVARLSVPQG
jgi:hypothetical protein